MSPKVMLAPNPNRSMLIDRVIVIGQSQDGQRLKVLNVDALGKNPKLMQPYGSRYSLATVLWNYVAALVLFGSIGFSFFWHWWAFIPGFFSTTLILKATRQSTADFAAEILLENKIAYDDFTRLGLVWEIPVQSVVPEG